MPRALGDLETAKLTTVSPSTHAAASGKAGASHQQSDDTAHTNCITSSSSWPVGWSVVSKEKRALTLVQYQAQIQGPILLRGSLGSSRLRSHQARPAAGRGLGYCGSRLAGLFSDSLPLLNELICCTARGRGSHFPARSVREGHIQAGTQAGREGQASKEGREERLSKEKMLCDVRNRIGGQGGPPR